MLHLHCALLLFFVIFLSENIYFSFSSCISWSDVTCSRNHVFCTRTLTHVEERNAFFVAGSTVIILSYYKKNMSKNYVTVKHKHMSQHILILLLITEQSLLSGFPLWHVVCLKVHSIGHL